MTLDNNSNMNVVYCPEHSIKSAIMNNTPIESKLHVVIVVSNPCEFKKRYKLAIEFMERIELYNKDDVELYLVELAYGNQKYKLTSPNNPKHLQLRTEIPLWHKENMINLGVRKLLPPDWKAFAWIDADIEFENQSWASDTLKILNGYCDIIQLFSHAIDMDENKNTMSIFTSFGYQYSHKKPYVKCGPDFWHPGFAWACNRTAFDKMGGLYDKSILGSGDHYIALSLIKKASMLFSKNANQAYKDSISEYEKKAYGLRLGYIPGVIKHYYHGSKKNRKYSDRYKILDNHQYNASSHITYDDIGLIIPTKEFPMGLVLDIMNYFRERNEDEQ